MPVSYLTRVDAARNMHRFYMLAVQPDLFGQYAIIREWGRIGRGGTVRQTSYASEAEAVEALEKCQKTRLRRGYVIAHSV